VLDTTECRRPVQWNAVADSRFGTLVIRHRIQSNSAMGKSCLLSSNFRIGHNPLGTRDVDGVSVHINLFPQRAEMDLIGEDIQFHLRMRSH